MPSGWTAARATLLTALLSALALLTGVPAHAAMAHSGHVGAVALPAGSAGASGVRPESVGGNGFRSQGLSPVLDGSHPTVDVAAFRGQGRLAFLWNGRLYLLDGGRGTLRQITWAGQIGEFSWSPDGRWLAYTYAGGAQAGQLWLARADGSGARRMTGLPTLAGSYTWVQDTGELAVAGSGHVWLVAPTGRPHMLAASGDGLLSLDGRTLAYAVTLPFKNPEMRSDALYTVPAAGGKPTRRFLGVQEGIELVGWWPNGKGLLFWRDPMHSASLAADGLGLFTMPLGGTPRLLLTALTYGDWLSWSPSGRTLLVVAGGDREVWHDKALATCDVVAETCRALPRPPGVVMLDPAWSPRGNRIAFVQAKDRGLNAVFTTPQMLPAWVRTHTLWIANADGTGAHALPAAGRGIYRPLWSRDGHHLLFIRDDALWLIDTGSGAPVKIVGPFPGTPDLFGFYGHASWPITVAWSG